MVYSINNNHDILTLLDYIRLRWVRLCLKLFSVNLSNKSDFLINTVGLMLSSSSPSVVIFFSSCGLVLEKLISWGNTSTIQINRVATRTMHCIYVSIHIELDSKHCREWTSRVLQDMCWVYVRIRGVCMSVCMYTRVCLCVCMLQCTYLILWNRQRSPAQ